MTNITFRLDRDLCFFDLEATGLNVVKDRIIQFAFIKYPKDGGEPIEYTELLDPGMPITPEATTVHGYTNADLKGKPSFQDVALRLAEFIGTADLAGYNSNRFDIPLLMEEFERADLPLKVADRRLIDCGKIFFKMEPRTLKAALRFYCGEEMVDAHDALADVRATVQVLKGQISRYQDQDYVDNDGQRTPTPVRNDMQSIHDFINDGRHVDVTQRLKRDPHGTVVFNFGKYTGQAVADVLRREPHYGDWILKKEFGIQVKNYIREAMRELRSA